MTLNAGSLTRPAPIVQKYVEDPLSEALIQGHLGEASLVEMFVDGVELNFRSITIDETGLEQTSDLMLTP